MPASNRKVAEVPRKRKVLLVEDHPIVSEGLTKRINAEPDLVVCAEAHTPARALSALDEFQPDVVVTDLAFPGAHGLELIKEIRALHRQLPILVFTMFDESIYGVRCLRAGAQGYVNKHEPPDRLLAAIRTVLMGNYALSPQMSGRFVQGSFSTSSRTGVITPERLGDRELEVFELIGQGKGTREIAAQLGRSVKTIETYRARIKDKLRLKSATALVREAVHWLETRP